MTIIEDPNGDNACYGERTEPGRGQHTIKIVLDITRLVQEGKITQEQAEQLKTLAARDTGTLAITILMAFGAIGVAAGILALNPAFRAGRQHRGLFACMGQQGRRKIGRCSRRGNEI